MCLALSLKGTHGIEGDEKARLSFEIVRSATFLHIDWLIRTPLHRSVLLRVAVVEAAQNEKKATPRVLTVRRVHSRRTL